MHIDNSDDDIGKGDGDVEFVGGTGSAFPSNGEHGERIDEGMDCGGNAETGEDKMRTFIQTLNHPTR